MDSQIEYHFIRPQPEISDFVESFWMLENHSEDSKEAMLLPDGRIDLILSKSSSEPFHIVLLGIETLPEQIVIPAKTKMFAISFTLLAVEYILNESVADLLGKAKILNNDFLGFDVESLNDFKTFHVSATQKK